MNSRPLLIIVLGLLVSAANAEVTLTITTFNCEFLTRPKVHIKFGLPFNMSDASEAERDQWEEPGFRDSKFTVAAKAVAGVVAELGADVVALTEVGDETDVTELRDEIAAFGVSYPYIAVCDSSDHTTKQHVAVLSKFSLDDVHDTIPGREGYDEELDDPETEADTGISKGMSVSFTASGRTFHIYVVHLASERNGHEQDAQRIAQASIVRRSYLPRLRLGEFVMVAGDLNDHRGQPAIRRIRGRDDIDADLIQTGGVKYFDDDELDARWTYIFQGERNQIDHILLSDSIKNTCKTSKGIRAHVVAHDEPLASDHRPLIVVLRLEDSP